MRKLMSKKGFTLVELMIVVVIMGILVAVAVPVYGAVTKNARKKTCQSNIRIIKENITSYQMTGGPDGATLEGDKLQSAIAASNPTFLNLFEGGVLPTCPTAGAAYSVAVNKDATSGATTYAVLCTDATEAADHNGTE